MAASTREPVGEAEARAAISRLGELSADLRGCAILDATGGVLGASGDAERWSDAGGAFLAAVDAGHEEPVGEVHVATDDGHAFAVRDQGLAMVAVAERFTLASLLVFDMRVVLRELVDGGADEGVEAARGRSVALGPDADAGGELVRAAARLIEAAG